jgi:hypothetical protein
LPVQHTFFDGCTGRIQHHPIETIMKERFSPLPPGVPPAGFTREQAAYYWGISPSKFDELRKTGEAPPAKNVGGRAIFLKLDLDIYITRFPTWGGAADPDGGGQW